MVNLCSGVMPLLAILAAPAHASDATYTVTELGMLGGGFSVPLSINNAGQVVGRYEPESGLSHSFLWQLGVMVDLEPDGFFSEAWAINNAGTIVGQRQLDLGQQRQPVIFADGSFIDLGTLGGPGGWVSGINNAGAIVGWAMTKELHAPAVIWCDGGITELGSAGGTNAVAREINESGLVAGEGSDEQFNNHALMWDGGEPTDLGNLGGSWATANSINEAGVIVGNSDTAAGATHGYRWTATEGMVDLGTLPGCANSSAHKINRHGDIVGVVWPCAGGSLAVMWKDGRIIDLNTLVPPGSITIWSAFDINDAGQIIGLANVLKAVLLTPVGLGDIDNDGHVSVIDLLGLLANWGGCAAHCPADLNHDGVVDRLDLMLLLGNWHQ